MMRRTRAFALVLLGSLLTSPAIAKSVSVVQHISGYRCMSLNLTQTQMMDPNVVVPVLAQPATTAARVGVAAATIAVRDPPHEIHGFLEVLFPTGQTGWVEARLLRPWRGTA